MKKCDDNENESLSLPKKIYSTVRNWLGFAFGLFIGVVHIVLTSINNSLEKSNEKAIIVIPIWVWVIVALAFVLLGVVVIIVIRAGFQHHYLHHNNGTICNNRINEFCKGCEKIQLDRTNDCRDVIEKMNLKIEQQRAHLLSVDNLVVNAQKLEKLYADAVSERLRTNKQVAAIEAEVKPNTEIYIMTSSFLFERFDPDMRSSMVNNINKGVKYRYIIPDGSENEFSQMVYAILADESLYDIYKNTTNNNFLTAAKLGKEYFMLTIAYYELDSDSFSEVIVKLPADTLDEVAQEKPLTYLVPKGTTEQHGRQKYNSEHKIVLDNLRALYKIGKKENDGELKLTAGELKQSFPNGVEIATSPSDFVLLK